MIGGGVTAGVACSQQPGQRFTAGDLGAVQKRQQRVVAVGLLPGCGRVLLVVGMVDGDGGVNVDMQPPVAGGRGTGGPRRGPRIRTCRTDCGQVGGVDPLVDQPPHCGGRGGRTEHVLTVPARLSDPVDAGRAVGDRRGEIGEHRARRVDPRAPIGVGQRRGDPGRQPGQLRQFPQHAHSGVGHDTMTVRRDFHPGNRCDTLHLRSAFPLESWIVEKSHYSLQDRHFRYITAVSARVSRKIRVRCPILRSTLGRVPR